ncbi:MAG: WD40/YVTN/BNR-like repeat-containing protein [Fimbriimonas sp.]
MTARVLPALLLFVVAPSVYSQGAPAVDPTLFDGLRWRQIGPFRGGRSLAAAGSVQRPKEYYFGATGGGVWKTVDGGASWTPVADAVLRTATVGAIAIAPSNPDIVVAGTGERDIRGDISHGDGLYRTTDGGKTWSHIGLRDTQTISRIVIHPTNPDVMWVASLGHIYAHTGPNRNAHRGIYKTTDGGKTWSHVLPGFDRAGAVHLTLDPSNPDVLMAATWEAWRTPYSLNSGGDGSRIFKSTDGGTTWRDISRSPGLPGGVLGKIGLTISPVDPKRYYALIEAHEGGLFRSDDAGATWTKVNDDRNWRQRAWYYTHVHADPKDRDGVYLLNVGFGRSRDGGKTFSGMRAPHSDHHDLWIAPDNPLRMINANDGGANVSTDGGQTWTEQTFPTAQIYHVSTDNAFPYRILGAQQDNSTIRIASRTQGGGITANDWTGTAGGESGYVAAKPDDPDVVFGGSYGGDLSMLNHRTNQSRQIDPWPDNPMGHGVEDAVHRFQWTYPIVFSPHDPNTLYTCSQHVLKTTNGGQTWHKISPDLTRNDKSTMGPSGGPITKDNTSVEYYGTVFTVAESPRRRGVIWAGSDDGLIHVTQDGGKTWRNITPKGMPKWGLVSMIDASPHDPAVAYVAVDNHENDDYRPYIYRTGDYGRTWQELSRSDAFDTYVRVVREDRKRKGLLYAGTETGVLVSFDDGGHWQPLRLNMPVVPVHDLAWKDDDLIAATHGRAFWVLDDLSPLQQLRPGEAVRTPRLFQPKDAWRVRWGGSRGANVGANPLSGLVLNYYLPEDAKDLKFEFRDRQGQLFQTVTSAPAKKGFQRTSAWLQMPSYRSVPGMIIWSGFPSPITMPPGEYTVTMVAGDVWQTQKFRWVKDPRSTSSDRDLQAQHRFQRQVAARIDEANGVVLNIRRLRTDLDRAVEEAAKKGDATALRNQVEALKARLTPIEEAIYQTKNRSGQDPLNYPIRLNDKLSGVFSTVSSGDFRPTDQAVEVFGRLSKQLAEQEARLKGLLDGELKAVNAELTRRGVAPVKETSA